MDVLMVELHGGSADMTQLATNYVEGSSRSAYSSDTVRVCKTHLSLASPCQITARITPVCLFNAHQVCRHSTH